MSDKKSSDKKSKKGLKKVGKAPTAAQQAAMDKKRLDRAEQQRLAQIINLHISGYSLAEIGTAIGSTADEVDRMIQGSATRYIRNQPALRAYVRNYVSGKYTELLEPMWGKATNAADKDFMEAQDRALRTLKEMARLHGAEAPVQKEVTVDAAPAAVEAMVAALAAQQGRGYDVGVFDVVEGEIVHDAVGQSAAALEVSGNRVEEGDEEL